MVHKICIELGTLNHNVVSASSSSSMDRLSTLAGLPSLLLRLPPVLMYSPPEAVQGEFFLPPWRDEYAGGRKSLLEPEEPVLATESLLSEPFRLVGVDICSLTGRSSEVRELMYFWKRAP